MLPVWANSDSSGKSLTLQIASDLEGYLEGHNFDFVKKLIKKKEGKGQLCGPYQISLSHKTRVCHVVFFYYFILLPTIPVTFS